MKLVAGLTGFALVLLSTLGHVRAQARDPATADALFREARALLAAGDYQAACPKLQESQRLDPAAGTAINLGDCYEKTGKLADALQSYRDAVDLLHADDTRLAPAKEQVAALAARVPRLTIQVPSDAPVGTKVRRDDVELGAASLGTALPVNPGAHTVVVSAPGREDVTLSVTLAEREHRELQVHAGTARAVQGESGTDVLPTRQAGVPAPAPADASVPGSGSRTLGWVFAGVGAAGLGTGIATGVMLGAKQSTVDANCNSKTKICNQAGYDAARSGQTLRTVSFIGWGVGFAGLAAGSYFLFIAEPTKRSATNVSAVAAPGGAFVSVSRRF